MKAISRGNVGFFGIFLIYFSAILKIEYGILEYF
jgi:hypothetical protein